MMFMKIVAFKLNWHNVPPLEVAASPIRLVSTIRYHSSILIRDVIGTLKMGFPLVGKISQGQINTIKVPGRFRLNLENTDFIYDVIRFITQEIHYERKNYRTDYRKCSTRTGDLLEDKVGKISYPQVNWILTKMHKTFPTLFLRYSPWKRWLDKIKRRWSWILSC